MRPASLSPTVETKVRLSHTRLWEFQKDFYRQNATQAWHEKVPFFSTSNVFIAHCYANIIIRLLQDWLESDPDPDEPFYVLELGAGTGMFGFYLMSQLVALEAELGLPQGSFVYVMSDFVDGNIEFWRSHPALRPFLEAGRLGLARFEAGVADRLPIELRGTAGARVLEPAKPAAKPLVVVANYVFDSLPCDLFRLSEAGLEEGLARPNIRPNDNAEINLSGVIDEAGFDFTYRPATMPYYGHDRYDAILAGYAATLSDASVLFPIGALECLETLQRLASGKMVVLATDKAFGHDHDWHMAQQPAIVLHNRAFSFSVNFHALGEYARLCGGSAHQEGFFGPINTSLFAFGADIDELVETRQAVAHHIDGASPSHLFSLFGHFERTMPDCSLEEIVSHLQLLRWDPYVLSSCLPILADRLRELGYVPEGIRAALHRSTGMFYLIPGGFSFFDSLGVFFQSLGEFSVALEHYDEAARQFPPDYGRQYNVGLCRFLLGEYSPALDAFREALALSGGDDVLIKGWIVEAQEAIMAGALAARPG